MKRSIKTILAGTAGGTLVGAVSLTFYMLFCSCGAGLVHVYQTGWQVLLPATGYGMLVGAITGAIYAPLDASSATIIRFIVKIAILSGFAYFFLILAVAWLSH